MKIKDLLEFNPEAELEIIMEDGLPFSGELSLGWINGDGGDSDSPNNKKTATNVCILLNERKEYESNN